jgi:hypothetical protein
MSLILDGSNGVSDIDGTAATPAIRGTDANTGIFFPAADTIAFSEGGVEQMRLNSAGDLQMNSGYGSVATAYGCRAWVNFNGIGTVAIRGSGNVSSITDNGVGDYTVNFTTAMPDAIYSVTGTAQQDAFANADCGVVAPDRALGTGALTTTSVRLDTVNSANTTGTAQDMLSVQIAIFR